MIEEQSDLNNLEMKESMAFKFQDKEKIQEKKEEDLNMCFPIDLGWDVFEYLKSENMARQKTSTNDCVSLLRMWEIIRTRQKNDDQ